MATVTTSIGTNTSIDTEVPSSGSGSNPYTVTFGTDPTGVSVGDSVHFDNGMGTVYVYLVTNISGSNYTLKWISGGMGATNPYGIVDMSYSQASGVFKRTYSTISAWESDLDNTSYYSSSDDAIGEVYNDSVFDEQVIIESGGTVGLSSVKLTAPESERHDGTEGNGARIEYTGSSTNSFVLKINNVTVEFLEFDLSSAGSGVSAGVVIGTHAEQNVFVQNCIIHDLVTQSNHIHGLYIGNNSDTPTSRHALNNIIYNIDNSSTSKEAMGLTVETPNQDVYVYNNTVYYVKTTYFTRYAYCFNIKEADIYARNNIGARAISTLSSRRKCFGGNGQWWNADHDYDLSTDNTADDGNYGYGANAVINEAYGDLFLSDTAGSEDLHLKTGAGAIGAGVDLGTSPTGVNIDIDGRDRDSEGDDWDIGADQTAVAAVNVTPTNAGITGTAHADLHAVAPLNAGITGTAHADLHSVIPVNAGIAAAAHADLHAVQPVNAGITATAATGPLIVTPTHASIAATSHSTVLAVLPSVATITATAADDFNEVIPAPATITATAVDNFREYTPAPATITASAEPPPNVAIPTAPSVTATSHNDTLAIDVVHCSVTASAHKNILAVIPPHASMSHALVMSLETMVTPVHAGISASCTTPIAVTPDPATIESSLTRNEEVQPEEITIISSAFIALVESPSELLISIVDSADASSSALSNKVTAIQDEVRTWIAYKDTWAGTRTGGDVRIINDDETKDDPWTTSRVTGNKYVQLSAIDSSRINNPGIWNLGMARRPLFSFFIRFGNFITGKNVSKCEVKLYRTWPTTFTTGGQARRLVVTDPESSQWRDIRAKIHLGDYDDSPEILGTAADLVASYNSRSLRSAYVTQDYSAGNGAWIDEDLGYREGVTDEEIEACSITTDITSLLQDLISNREWEDGNHITIFWEEPTLVPPSDPDYDVQNGVMFAGGGPVFNSKWDGSKTLRNVIPNWHLALPKLIITYSAEVENVVFIDPATSTASTAIGTIAAGTTVLHPVARMSATAPDATVADIQQPIMSLLGVAKEYSNVVVYQNNVGEVFAVKGFGPAEPVNTATDDQIISLSSHASGYSNLLVYQKGDGSVVMKKDSRLSSPNSPASTQIISSHGFNLSSGKVVVITQDGDGDVKVKSDIT